MTGVKQPTPAEEGEGVGFWEVWGASLDPGVRKEGENGGEMCLEAAETHRSAAM